MKCGEVQSPVRLGCAELKLSNRTRTSGPRRWPPAGHTIDPYFLRDLVVSVPDAVWCADITYIPMRRGFVHLVAVMDWFSRYVGVVQHSGAGFCRHTLERALEGACPVIFNTEQGSPFTGAEFTGALLARDVRISMDGLGRTLDNVFIEGLCRIVKYEQIYLHEYDDGVRLRQRLSPTRGRARFLGHCPAAWEQLQ